MHVLIRTLPAFLLTAVVHAQSVHVVHGGTGGGLQSAIDAAASGDTILVHGGSFGAVSIVSKALTIIAEPAHGTTVTSLAIHNLAANQRCVVSGLDVMTTPNVDAVQVSACDGSVRLQDVHAFGGTETSADALVVTNANNVACMRCVFQGGSQVWTPFGPEPAPSAIPVGRGVVCSSAQLALHDCNVTGGNGQDDHLVTPTVRIGAGRGGLGLDCGSASFVYANRTSFTGGVGGDGLGVLCLFDPCGTTPTNGANGGAGVSVASGASLHVLDGVRVGGAGGAGGPGGMCACFLHPPGANGISGPMQLGPVTNLSGSGTGLSAPSAVRVGNMLPLTIHGTPGDVIFLAVSSQTRFVFDPFYSGVFLFGPAARRSSFGVVPGSGMLNVSIPVGSLPVGAQSAVRHLQVLARDPMGQLRLGAASVVTVLDPSF